MKKGFKLLLSFLLLFSCLVINGETTKAEEGYVFDLHPQLGKYCNQHENEIYYVGEKITPTIKTESDIGGGFYVAELQFLDANNNVVEGAFESEIINETTNYKLIKPGTYTVVGKSDNQSFVGETGSFIVQCQKTIEVKEPSEIKYNIADGSYDEYENFVSTDIEKTFQNYSNTYGIDEMVTPYLVPTFKLCADHSNLSSSGPVDDMENCEWSIGDDSIATLTYDENNNPKISFKNYGQVQLTCKYNTEEITTTLYIERQGVSANIVNTTTKVTTNKFFEPEVTVVNVGEKDSYSYRYVLTKEMQDLYGVKYFSSLKGVQYEGTYLILQELADTKIDFELVAFDYMNSHHLEYCVNEMDNYRNSIDTSGLDVNTMLNMMARAEELCDCAILADDNGEYIHREDIYINGSENTVTSIPLSVEILKDTTDNNGVILSELRDYLEQDDAVIVRHQSMYLFNLFNQHKGNENGMQATDKLDFTYEQLLDFNFCLEKLLGEQIEITINSDADVGDIKVEGLITAVDLVPAEDMPNSFKKQAIQFNSQIENNSTEIQKIQEEVTKQDGEILSTYDLTIGHAVSEDGETFGEYTLVTETNNPVTITMDLPEGYDDSKDLIVLRKHGDVIEPLECTITENGVAFETDKFSTYSFVQVDKETFEVTFKNGETSTSSTVVDGDVVDEPTTPTKEGYKFLGWYVDGNKFDFSTSITKDITLEAKWEKVSDNKTETGGSPSIPGDSIDPDEEVDKGNTETESETEDKTENKTQTQTGDNAPVVMFATVTMLSCAAMVVLNKKKKTLIK